MRTKCIAAEVIRAIQRGTLIDLVTECAESFGYSAQRAYETAQEQPISGRFLMVNPSQAVLNHHRHLRTRLALFATDKSELELTGTGTMVQLGAVLVIPIPPNMRVQVWCESDWQGIGCDTIYAPCEVGAAIMRFLLRMVEGVERADAGRAPWEESNNDAATKRRNEVSMIKWTGSYIHQVLVPYDLLDVAVSRMAEGYTAKLANVVRDEIIAGGRVVYTLSWNELGTFGQIELYKEDSNATCLEVQYASARDKELTERRKRHLDLVMEAMFAAFEEDGIWEKHFRAVEVGSVLSETPLPQRADTPSLPKRDADLAKWRATWRLIRERVEKGWNAREIEADITRNPDDFRTLPSDEKTLRKIIRAGNVRLLD